MKISANAARLLCPAGNFEVLEDRHDTRQAVLLPAGGDFELLVAVFGIRSDSEEHLPLEISREPARDDLREIRLRIAELPVRSAEEPQRAERRRGRGNW